MNRIMKVTFGIGDTFPRIREEDIFEMATYADKEANPLYPVPVLWDRIELSEFYYRLMEKPVETEEMMNTSELTIRSEMEDAGND